MILNPILGHTQYLPPARPNGLALHQLVNTTTASLGNDSVLNISTRLLFVPASCDYHVPMLEFVLLNSTVSGEGQSRQVM